MGEIAALSREGDTKIKWNRDDPGEVEAARIAFNQYRADNHIAFRLVGSEGERGEQMTEFDPEAERIIMVPQMRGG